MLYPTTNGDGDAYVTVCACMHARPSILYTY
jgi:hypothetical protein